MMMMMTQWFEAERHHQVKTMGKPRAVREIHILQTSSFLAIGEPHVRPCEVVQGLKMYSSWFWLFSAVWDVLLVGQSSSAVWCWYLGACRRGSGRVSVFMVVWAQLGNEKQMACSFSALIFMVATKHVPTTPCCSLTQCWFKAEPVNAPELLLQSHHWAPSKQKPLPELTGCYFSWLCIWWVLQHIMYLITVLCTVPFKSCSCPCPKPRARTPACPASPLQPQVLGEQCWGSSAGQALLLGELAGWRTQHFSCLL